MKKKIRLSITNYTARNFALSQFCQIFNLIKQINYQLINLFINKII